MVWVMRSPDRTSGTHQAHALAHAGSLQRAQEADAAVAHGVILEPGVRRVRRDQQGLEIRVRAQALRQRLGHRRCR